MRVFSESTVEQEWKKKHPDAASSLDAFVEILKRETWTKPHDVKSMLNSADFISSHADRGSLYVFDIMGNRYRIIARVKFAPRSVFLKMFLTHAEYSKICPIRSDDF